MDGFFPLRSAVDLRDKLRRDLLKIRADNRDHDLYFNFFVTAEAMRDWVFPGRENKKRRERLLELSAYLRVCSHLANGAKHLKVEAKHHDAVASTGLMSSDVVKHFMPGTFPDGMFPDYLGVELDGEVATTLGPRIAAEGLAYQVLSFWERYALNPSEENDPWFNSPRPD